MGNSNNKYKMDNAMNDISEGIANMEIVETPGWISDTSTIQLENYRREILLSMMRNDQQTINAWTSGDISQPVTEQNRKEFENNFFVYLKNLENLKDENIGIPTVSDIMNMTKPQLIEVCKYYSIHNYSGKNKDELRDYIISYFNY